jgi:hypothetical protein
MKNNMKIQFPAFNPDWAKKQDINAPHQYHRYYSTHPQYVLNLLIKGGAEVEMVPATDFDCRETVAFDCKIDGHLCRFDFNDHEKYDWPVISKYKAYFKFHYSDEAKSKHNIIHFPNIFPFSPVNFHNWDLYNKLEPAINYSAKGKVLNNQAPAGAAIARRNHVAKILKEAFGNNLDRERYPKEEFYKLINSASAIVCVPGARNNMLDRAQGQQIGFGACTISPKLVTYLSYHKQLIPGVHYVECKPDYSDLIEKVNWVRDNPKNAIKIGQNAKQLFLETSTPKMQIAWIKECINN